MTQSIVPLNYNPDEATEQELWEQLPGEPLYWYAKFIEFRDMGPTRTLRKYYRMHRMQHGQTDIAPEHSAPSNWNQKFHDWRWKERAEAWDAYQLEEMQDREDEVLHDGLVFEFERIDKLKKLAEKLEKLIFDPRIKPSAIIVEQYRGVLDDIAKERGQRIKETKTTSTQNVFIETEWGRGGSASQAWVNQQIEAPTDAIEAVVKVEEQ